MINNFFKIKYSDEELVCFQEEEVFYRGFFEDKVLEFKNGNQIIIENKRLKDFFWFNRKIVFLAQEKRISAEFICKKIKGLWKLQIEDRCYSFDMKKGYRIDVKMNTKTVCLIDLNEIESKRNFYKWVYYDLNFSDSSKIEEICALIVVFMRFFILNRDTEGTRLPSSIGNIS